MAWLRIGNAVRVFIIHYRNRDPRRGQSTVARTLEALRASPRRDPGCLNASETASGRCFRPGAASLGLTPLPARTPLPHMAQEALNRLGISDPRDYAPPPPAQRAPERAHTIHPREQLRPRLPPGFHVPALLHVAARKHVPAGRDRRAARVVDRKRRLAPHPKIRLDVRRPPRQRPPRDLPPRHAFPTQKRAAPRIDGMALVHLARAHIARKHSPLHLGRAPRPRREACLRAHAARPDPRWRRRPARPHVHDRTSIAPAACAASRLWDVHPHAIDVQIRGTRRLVDGPAAAHGQVDDQVERHLGLFGRSLTEDQASFTCTSCPLL